MTVTDTEKHAAWSAGRFAGRSGMPLAACPFDPSGDGQDKARALWFVRGFQSVSTPSDSHAAKHLEGVEEALESAPAVLSPSPAVQMMLRTLEHGNHDQSTHGRKGPRGAVKAAAKRAAKADPDVPQAKLANAGPGKVDKKARKALPNLKDLFPADGGTAGPKQQAKISDTFAQVFDGEYPGGLRITETGANHVGETGRSMPRGLINFGGTITDAAGNEVGYFRRTMALQRDEDGGPMDPPRWIVKNERLFLDESVQGTGFARAFNAKANEWYRQSGMDYVDLDAGDNVGGYAWASQGFDFSSRGALQDFVINGEGRKDPRKSKNFDPKAYAEQAPLLDALIERAERGEWVSAYEISQLGRKPGQGKDDWWIGKAAMLGGSFPGRLAL